MWKLGERTPRRRFLHSFLQTCPHQFGHGDIGTYWLVSKDPRSLFGFLHCQREQQTTNGDCGLMKDETVPSSVVRFHFCSTFGISCQCQDCCVLYIHLFHGYDFHLWLQRSLCLCFWSLMFKRHFFVSHPPDQNGACPYLAVSRWRGKRKFCGHLTLSSLLFCAICSLFMCLASSRSLTIFDETDHSEASTVQTMVLAVVTH